MNERVLSYGLAMNLACYAMLLDRMGVKSRVLFDVAPRDLCA